MFATIYKYFNKLEKEVLDCLENSPGDTDGVQTSKCLSPCQLKTPAANHQNALSQM